MATSEASGVREVSGIQLACTYEHGQSCDKVPALNEFRKHNGLKATSKLDHSCMTYQQIKVQRIQNTKTICTCWSTTSGQRCQLYRHTQTDDSNIVSNNKRAVSNQLPDPYEDVFKYEGDGTTLQSCFSYKLFANMSRVIAEYLAKQTYCNVCVTSFEPCSKPFKVSRKYVVDV